MSALSRWEGTMKVRPACSKKYKAAGKRGDGVGKSVKSVDGIYGCSF